MAVTWRFEAWTHPRLGTPTRVSGYIPFTRAQLADREDAVVDSWIEIPAVRRSDVEALLNIDPVSVGNSTSRIIRAYRVDEVDPVPVDGAGDPLPDHEFVAADLTWRIADDGTQLAKIAGPDLRGSLDDARILAYDYPKQPTTARDWQWNGPTLADNGDLENLSAEIQAFYISGIGAADTYTVTFDTQTTPALTWGADANVRLTNLETALEALSNIGDVEIIGEGTVLDPFEILFVDPAGADLPTIVVTPTVGTATVSTISTGGFPSIEGWSKSNNPVTGLEHGAYTDFRSTSPFLGEAGLGGSAGAVTMTIPAGEASRFAGGQMIVSVTPGSLLQLSITAKCSSTTDTFRFVVRDLVGDTESRLGSSPELTFTTAGVEQTFTLDNVRVRPNVERVLVRFAVTSAPAAAFSLTLDNLVVQEGFRGTTKGGIVQTLHNDLSVAHAPRTRLGWVTLGFGAANDSSGTPWAETDLPYAVRHGMQFGSHVLGGLQDLASSWDLVPVTATTWRLDLWDEANRGTDHTSDPAVAFLVGQIADGAIQHRLPAETGVTAVGEGGVWAEVTDPGLVTAFGPIDGFAENSDWLDASTAGVAAGEMLGRQVANALSVKATTTSAMGPVPFKQVRVGDRAPFILGTVAKHTRRVRQCTVTITPDSWSAEWVASRVFMGESATQEALRRVLTDWERRQFTARRGPTVPPAASFPGKIPGLVAGSDAADEWKAVASYICDGTNDSAMLQAAADDAWTGGGPKQILAVGSFTLTAALDLRGGVALVGVGANIDGGSGTYLERTGGPVIALNYGGNRLDNLAVVGIGAGASAISALSIGDLIITDCYLLSDGAVTVRLNGVSLAWVTGCRITTGGGNPAVHWTTAVDSHLTECVMQNGGVLVDVDTRQLEVASNLVQFSAGDGIHVAGTANRVRIAHNLIEDADHHGIVVADTTAQVADIWIHNNAVAGAGYAADNTYDGILIDGAVSRVDVRDNRVEAQAGATHMRWGINPSDTVVDCRIVGNELTLVGTATFGSGPIRTASTGDVSLTLPADATYGDNWT